MTITHVQSIGEASAGTSHTLAFLSNVTAGSFLLCAIRETSGLSPTVADNINGSWTAIGTAVAYTTNYLHLFKFENSGAGAMTVTVTTASATIRYTISEYSGVAASSAVEDFDGASFTDLTATTSSTVTTTGADRRIVAAVILTGNGTDIIATGGEDERVQVDARLQVQDEAAETAGDYSSSWSWTGTFSGAQRIIALAPPAAAGGSLLVPQYDRMFRQNTLLRM